MGPTVAELAGVHALAVSLGVTAIRVIRFVPHGRAQADDGLRLNGEQLNLLQVQLNQLRFDERLDLRVGSAFGFLVDFAPHCTAGIEELVVNWDGTVYPCSGFAGYQGPEAIGNAIETSLEDVWEQSPFLEAMRQLMTNRLAACTREVGCPAQKAAVAGRITDDVPDPDSAAEERRSTHPALA
jgi:radical SAM protein with 4Fe4S-binding SPASM domain